MNLGLQWEVRWLHEGSKVGAFAIRTPAVFTVSGSSSCNLRVRHNCAYTMVMGTITYPFCYEK